ncbi:WD40 repeat domain-containing protein [Planobispora takensis]|uniref:WD40 repeat domain-containing protein n=1 Tax=Planobispora takensis TaxID=1367882 RepID=UPI001942C872|nr:WD40 repeat domain-containing protein [Planobispora takensis]
MLQRLLERTVGAGKAVRRKRMVAQSAATEVGGVEAGLDRELTGHRMTSGSLLTGRSAAVFTVHLSRSRGLVATGGADGTVRLWHAEAPDGGQVLAETGNAVHSVRFSADGTMLAAGGNDKQVRIWDLSGGPAAARLLPGTWRHHAYVLALAWSPDGRHAACAAGDGRVAVRDPGSARTLWETKVKAGPLGVGDIAFSPADGGRLALPAWRAVSIVEAGAGQRVLSLTTGKHNVDSVAYSPDGKLIAAGVSDGTVRVWRVADGTAAHTLRVHAPMAYSEGEPVGRVTGLAFAPSGRFLASGGWDGVVKIWRAADGALLREVEPGRGVVHALAWSADDTRLAVAAHDGVAQLWSIS